MDSAYTAKDAVRVTHISYATLNLWANSEFIVPSIAAGTGRGSKSLYSFWDLLGVKVFWDLKNQGIPKRKLQTLVKYLRTRVGLDKLLANAKLIVLNNDVISVANKNELFSALTNDGQGCFAFLMINVATAVREIEKEVLPARSQSRKKTKM